MTTEHSHRVEKEMGFSHEEILRKAPQAFAAWPHTIDPERIVVGEGDRRVEIALAPERVRRLGSIIRLPVTDVVLTFHGYSSAERATFLQHFESQYHKGGG